MQLFMVALLLATATFARSDISHVPSGSYLPGLGGGNFGYTNQGSFVTGGLGGNFLGGGSYSGGVNLLGGASFTGGNLGGGIGGFGTGGGGHLVHDHKQVHFFGAHDEAQDRLRIYVAPNSARNTKVIFVKAPSYGALRPEVIAPASQTEDRTKVYVLVKRPESGGAITIPSSLTNKPTKPEVYFIKYRTEQEAEQALAGGLQEQAVGPSAPELGNAQSFVSTLKDFSSGIGGGIGGISSSFGGSGGFGGISGIGGGDISGSNLLGGVSGGNLGGVIGGSAGHGPAGVSGPY